MREEIIELKQLKSGLLGLEMDLTLIERDLVIVANDIDFLKKMEKDLIFNVKLLRKKNVIAIASEYKKSVEELKEVQQDIEKYVNLKKQLAESYRKKHKEYKDNMKKFKQLEHDIKNKKVILLFSSKRKRTNNEK